MTEIPNGSDIVVVLLDAEVDFAPEGRITTGRIRGNLYALYEGMPTCSTKGVKTKLVTPQTQTPASE